MNRKYFKSLAWLLCAACAPLLAQTHTEVTIEDAQSITGAKTISGLNHLVLVDGTTYGCTGVGISSALAVAQAAGGGSIVDARGCIGSLTGGAWSLGSTVLLLGASSWAMGSNSVSVSTGALIGLGHNLTTLTWTGDVDGIASPAGTSNGGVLVKGVTLINGALATASHAVVHLIDCPYCAVDDFIINIDSTAASAGIRVETQTSNSGLGTWKGRISNGSIQRTSGNQGTSATSGQISLDFKGKSGITNGDISRWTIDSVHMEAGTIEFQIFCGTANHLYGADIYNGQPAVNITGSVACNSNDNIVEAEMNGTNATGSKAYAIDANSNYNMIRGDLSQQLVASTDAGAGNVKWYSTNSTGNSVFNLSGNTLTTSGLIAGLNAAGTAATLAGTGACATITTQAGGSWAGTFKCTGTTGASTVTITPGSTAPNGWVCSANDITHTLAGSQSAASTTAPVMSFTSVTANDVLNFSCTQY